MNTIVFVEDDAEVGALIAAYLAKHDMQVTVEPRGDRAEETILRENPDLVLGAASDHHSGECVKYHHRS